MSPSITPYVMETASNPFAEMRMRFQQKYRLRCQLSGQVRFSTTREQPRKTGRHQLERIRIK